MDILMIPMHIYKDPAKLDKFIKALSCPKCSSRGQLITSTAKDDIGKFCCDYCKHTIILAKTAVLEKITSVITATTPAISTLNEQCKQAREALNQLKIVMIEVFKKDFTTKAKILLACLIFLLLLAIVLPLILR